MKERLSLRLPEGKGRIGVRHRFRLPDARRALRVERFRGKWVIMRASTGSIRGWLIVLLAVGSWSVVSNRCALGLADLSCGRPKMETHGCCASSKSAPAGPHKDPAVPCCKTFWALQTSFAESSSPTTEFSRPAIDFVTSLTAPPRANLIILAARDTGPPALGSFASLVLQRSLCVHAPPILA